MVENKSSLKPLKLRDMLPKLRLGHKLNAKTSPKPSEATTFKEK